MITNRKLPINEQARLAVTQNHPKKKFWAKISKIYVSEFLCGQTVVEI